MINRVRLNGLEDHEYELAAEAIIGELRVWFSITAYPSIADDLLEQLQNTTSLTFLNNDDTVAAVIQNGIKFWSFAYIADENNIYSIEFERTNKLDVLNNRITALEESVNTGSTSDHTMESLVITTQAPPGTSTYFESKIKETSTIVGAPIDSISGITVPGIAVDPHDGFITITNQTGEYRTVKVTIVTII